MPTNSEIDTTALKSLLSLIGNDREILRELIDEFAGEGPALAQRITGALESGDADALRIASHTLKSNANDLGAPELSDRAAKIETAAKADDLDAAKAPADGIEQATSDTVSALRSVDLDGL